MKNGKLPFVADKGENIHYRNGYLFVDGKATQVSELYDDQETWLKVKAYITIKSGTQSDYTKIPKKGQDAETKIFIKLLNDKKFKSWVESNPIITKEKQNE